MLKKSCLLQLALIIGSGACKWSAFDDLRSEAWVRATSNPDDDASNWAVGIQRTSDNHIAVFGSSRPLVNEIEYKANGDNSILPNQQKFSDVGVGNLDPQPLALANPENAEVTLVTKSGGGSVAVLHGVAGQMELTQIFGPDSPDAATYIVAPGLDGNLTPQAAQPLVAAGGDVYGMAFGLTNDQPKCTLKNGATAVVPHALGAIRRAGNTSDDIVVWSAAGDLLVYSGETFNGPNHGTACPSMINQTPLAGPTATTFQPGVGSQIFVVDNRYALLQGHNDAGGGFVAMYDLDATPPAMVGTPLADAGAKTATIMNIGTERFIAVGIPSSTIDGTTAGEVRVYSFDTTAGIDASPAMILHDAQPAADQSFGRSLATMKFNGKEILVVAADNEVFAYYRTALYEDTRNR